MSNTKILIALLLLSLVTTNAVADIYDDAVAGSARSESDRAVDARRKPAEVLRFFEVKPNTRVFDVFAGGGYYSELLASVVGEGGEVVLYNNAPWESFVEKAVSARLQDNRLPNVTRLIADRP